MQALTDFFHRISNLPDLVQWAGLFGIAAIIFSETGLLAGVFLPGDSLLVTAGLFGSSLPQSAETLSDISSVAPLAPVSSGEKTASSSTKSMLSAPTSSMRNMGARRSC